LEEELRRLLRQELLIDIYQIKKNIIRLAIEGKLEEIKSEESGVSLRKYKLPIE
jgi:hypothetical protein